MLLIIRAKLEAVESGITTLESEFLTNIVLPDSGTVGQWLGPQIEEAYQTGKMPPMPGGEIPDRGRYFRAMLVNLIAVNLSEYGLQT